MITEYKGYNIVPERSFAMLKIKAKGQGKVPDALTGSYTSRTLAQQAVDGYLASLLKGKKYNGKAESTRPT